MKKNIKLNNKNKIINNKSKIINNNKNVKKYKIDRLIFEGGGTKGLAIAGALQVINEYIDVSKINQFGGSSAGGIVALLLCLNYSIIEIKLIIQTLNFNKFKDDSFGFFRDIRRLLKEYGVYKGEYFYALVQKIITAKKFDKHITFLDLYKKTGKELLLTGTNLNYGRTDYFHYKTTPLMEIAKAVRITMSIPGIFKSIKHDDCIYVDGGLLNNYPFDSFYIIDVLTDRGKYVRNHDLIVNNIIDPNNVSKEYTNTTLGIRTDTINETIKWEEQKNYKIEINNIADFLESIIKTLIGTIDRLRTPKEFIDQTIIIPTEINAYNFNITTAEKNILLKQGIVASTSFFTKKNRILYNKEDTMITRYKKGILKRIKENHNKINK